MVVSILIGFSIQSITGRDLCLQVKSTNWIIKGVIRNGTYWYETAQEIWEELGEEKGLIQYLTLQEQKQYGRNWHQMRGWVQFKENMTNAQVGRFFPAGDWMWEISRSGAGAMDHWLDNNHHQARDGQRWSFGRWAEYPTEAVYVGEKRYFVAVKPMSIAIRRAQKGRQTRSKKASKKKQAFKQQQAWRKNYGKRKFEQPPMDSDEDSKE